MSPADEQAYLKEARRRSRSDMFGHVKDLANSADHEKLSLLLKHGVPLHGTGPMALRVAVSQGHFSIVKMLVEYGVPIEERMNIHGHNALTRNYVDKIEAIKSIIAPVKEHPERYGFLYGYRAEILLNGVMSPPYSREKVSMVAWALALGQTDAVFEKMAPHITPDSDIMPDVTYRAVIAQLGLKPAYDNFLIQQKIERDFMKAPRILHRRPKL